MDNNQVKYDNSNKRSIELSNALTFHTIIFYYGKNIKHRNVQNKKKDYNKNICFSDPCYFHSLNTANGHHFDFPYHSKMRTPSYNVQLLIPNHH